MPLLDEATMGAVHVGMELVQREATTVEPHVVMTDVPHVVTMAAPLARATTVLCSPRVRSNTCRIARAPLAARSWP